MSLLSWLSKFKKTPLEAESESSLSVGCDAPSTSKRPPTDTCSVLQSVEPADATRKANDCSSAANSGTSTTSLIDLSTPLQSSITPLESAQSLLPQSAHQPILAPRTYGKQTRSFCSSWYRKYQWLHYQEGSDTVLCYYCKMADKRGLVLHGNKDYAFARSGYSHWKKALEKLKHSTIVIIFIQLYSYQ